MAAGTPTEYYVRYRFTGQSNRGTDGKTPIVAKSSFVLSGNTNIQIGKVTRIKFRHYHSSTKSGNWGLRGRIFFSDGSSIDSDLVYHKFSSDVYCYTNTFTENLPSPEKLSAWSGIRAFAPNLANGQLYWRATSSEPFDVIIYFYDVHDLVDGAAAPTVSGITYTDEGTSAAYSRFGNFVQNHSAPVITGLFELDPNYQYIQATHSLVLTGADGQTIFSATQFEDAVFHVGIITTSGTISWNYTVADTAGNIVSKSGTFTVLPYAPPNISALNVERYVSTVDDDGNVTYHAADDGSYVRLTITIIVQSIVGKNAWSLSCGYGHVDADESGFSSIDILTGTDGQAIPISQDRTAITTVIDTSCAWMFNFSLTDYFASTTQSFIVDKSGGYANLEKYGFSIGKRSTATADNKKFEVAQDYTSVFEGPVEFRGGFSGENILTSLGFQSGRVSASSLASGKTAAYNITFDHEYAETPVVMATLRTTMSDYYVGRCVVAVTKVSTTGCSLRLYNYTGGSTTTIAADWLAVGKLK